MDASDEFQKLFTRLEQELDPRVVLLVIEWRLREGYRSSLPIEAMGDLWEQARRQVFGEGSQLPGKEL